MESRRFFTILALVLTTASPALAKYACDDLFNPTSAALWLPREIDFSVSHILKNISPSDARAGAVIAAQTRISPNYYFHWVRDAGLTVEAVLDRYALSEDPLERTALARAVGEYVDFTEQLQTLNAVLGEPKYNVDGSVYAGPWGRPQNDGPAIRATSVIRWFEILKAEGRLSSVEASRLYSAAMPATSVIKKDLEYVAHHWRDPSFDLWEEVQGDHFYTRMVQRRALRDGARLARALGDTGAADFYDQQGAEIDKSLREFWDPSRGYITATRSRVGGLDYKSSNLDIAVVLGFLHGGLTDGSFTNPHLLATMDALEKSFASLYPVNKNGAAGVAIGRYPEDKYGGDNFDGGNPWPLCTLAMAESYYRMAKAYADTGRPDRARGLIARGDAFVERVRAHSHPDGSLNEQFRRDTGFMTSVSDLTWNYSAVLTTSAARASAVESLP